MKTVSKVSKRFLALMLAALLLITSVPLSMMSVIAADEESQQVQDARAAIEAYESTMDGGGFYTSGMTAAYDAYVACNAMLDAVLYGDGTYTDNDLATKTAALESALNTMTSSTKITNVNDWTGAESINTKVPTWPGSESNSESKMLRLNTYQYGTFNEVIADADVEQNWGIVGGTGTFWNNILYTGNVTSAPQDKGGLGTTHAAACTTYGMNTALYYPNVTVLFYDGKKQEINGVNTGTSVMPVMLGIKATTKDDRNIYHLWVSKSASDISDNDTFYLINKNNRLGSVKYDWYGGMGTHSADYYYARTHIDTKTSGKQPQNGTRHIDSGKTYIGGFSTTVNATTPNVSAYAKWMYYASAITLDPDAMNLKFDSRPVNKRGYMDLGGTNSSSYYSADASNRQYWYFYAGRNREYDITGHPDNMGDMASSKSIIVLNYAGILRGMQDNMYKLTMELKNYRQGGARAFINAYEQAMAFRTASYFNNVSAGNDSQAVTQAQAAGQRIGEIIAALNTNPTGDNSAYATLRNAIAQTKPAYDGNNVDPLDGLQLYKLSTDDLSAGKVGYDTFQATYRAATAIMTAVGASNAYNTSAANVTAAATQLSSDYSNLETLAERVDTAQLEIVINNARYILDNKAFFNNLGTASQSNSITQNHINQWINTVWGLGLVDGAEAYGSGIKLKATPENQQIVDNLTQTILNRLNMITIKTTAEIQIGLDLHSLKSVVENINNENSANYGNFHEQMDEPMLWAQNFFNAVDSDGNMFYTEGGVSQPYYTSSQASTYTNSVLTYASGHVADSASQIVDRMAELTRLLLQRFETLTPALSLVKDGFYGSRGHLASDVFTEHTGRYLNFSWVHDTDVVILKNSFYDSMNNGTYDGIVTQNGNQYYKAREYDIGTSIFNWRTGIGSELEQCLDAIDLDDTSTLATGEFNKGARENHKAGMIWSDYNKFAVDQTIDWWLPSETNANVKFKFGEIKVTRKAYHNYGFSVGYGEDKNWGSPVTSEASIDFGHGKTEPTDALFILTTPSPYAESEITQTDQAAFPAKGGSIATAWGATEANAEWLLEMPQKARPADNDNGASRKATIAAETHTLGMNRTLYFGIVYSYEFADMGAIGQWGSLIGINSSHHPGWAHQKDTYTQSATVVDISELVALIKESSLLEQGNYTNPSWQAFTQKIADANKSEFVVNGTAYQYSEINTTPLTTDVFVQQCKNRYQQLYTARANLKLAANNTALVAAINAARPVVQAAVENSNGTVAVNSAADAAIYSNYAALKTAYQNAVNAYNGTYSNNNLRNLAAEDVQADIDALAQAVTDAQAALRVYANFAPLDTAETTFLNGIEDAKYTCSTLEAINTNLRNATNYPYYNVAANNRSSYTYKLTPVTAAEVEEAAVNQRIQTEANAILNYALTETTDSGTLAKAIEKFRAQYADPDAYDGIQDVIDQINAINITSTVNVLGKKNVLGINYEDQETLDAYAASIIPYFDAETNPLPKKTYDITIQDMAGNTIRTIPAQEYGAEIIIFSGTDASDSQIVDWYYYDYNSVSANNDGSYQGRYFGAASRIHYIVKGNATFRIKKGETAESKRVTYKINLSDKTYKTDYVNVGGSVTISTSDAPKVAFYKLDRFEYVDANGNTQTIADGSSATITNITKDMVVTAIYSPAADAQLYFYQNIVSGRYEENYYDALITDTSAEIRELNSEFVGDVYAWVTTDDFDILDDSIYPDPTQIPDSSKFRIIHYGADYSFRLFKDTPVYPVTLDELPEFTEIGYILDNYSECPALLYTEPEMRDFGTKVTTINSLVLPEGAQFQEAGILYYISRTGAVCPVEMTLSAAGDSSTKVKRAKSSSRTAGDQYTISISTEKFPTNITATFTYRAYAIVKINGEEKIIYSDTCTYEKDF